MFWLFVVALWTAMLLSPVLLLFFFLPAGRDCPRCGGETLLIRSRLLRRLRRVANLRWCMSCKWEGVMRPTAWPRPLPKLEVVPDDADDVDGTAPWRK
jgi:hypothetical protein